MSIKGKAYIVGAYEHPTRKATDKSLAQLHAEVAQGRARRRRARPRTTSTAISAPATRPASAAAVDGRLHGPEAAARRLHRHRRLVLPRPRRPRRAGDRGGQVQRRADHARRPAALGRHADRHRAAQLRRRPRRTSRSSAPTARRPSNMYAMCAMRHMHEYGTTSEQLAWIKVAASHHAQHNPHAMLREVVTVEEVVNSPMIVRSAAPARLLRGQRRRRRAHRGAARDRRSAEAAAGQGASAPARRSSTRWAGAIRPHLLGAALVGPGGLRRGRRQARRHQVRLDLRQLHHHRADAARGPRLLREGRRAASSSPTAT